MRRGQFGATSLFGHHPKNSLFELKEMNLSFSLMYHWSIGFSESTFFHFVENVITRSFLVGDYKTGIGTIESKFTQIEKRKYDVIYDCAKVIFDVPMLKISNLQWDKI